MSSTVFKGTTANLLQINCIDLPPGRATLDPTLQHSRHTLSVDAAPPRAIKVHPRRMHKIAESGSKSQRMISPRLFIYRCFSNWSRDASLSSRCSVDILFGADCGRLIVFVTHLNHAASQMLGCTLHKLQQQRMIACEKHYCVEIEAPW